MPEDKKKIAIIGTGPSGLSAAWELMEKGNEALILEQEEFIGGLCRTFDYRGYKFDLGGHRFFTKQPEVEKFWQDLMGDDFMTRNRLSRIYYHKKFFAYPIKLGDAFAKLGIWESFLIGLSLMGSRLRRIGKHDKEITFEDWVVNRFGRRLFNHFFKSYTEKLWGISVKELGADWAAQRMKDLSLLTILKTFIIKPKHGQVKSLIEKFQYPKYGPGMFYERLAEKLQERGAEIKLQHKVIKISHEGESVKSITVKNNLGQEEEIISDFYLSSMPLTAMLKAMSPAPPAEIMALAEKMRFRSFFDVCLIINKPEMFPDNWIYVHEPEVSLIRVQNFKNWSPFMVPDASKTNIGAEYVCWDTDELWLKSDEELIKLAVKELELVGLVDSGLVEDGAVIRDRFAYPVYHLDYQKDLAAIFAYLAQFKNFQTIGRSGLYRYNNMDHSILTGFYAARNIMGGNYDLLKVNADEEYHETGK